MHDDLKTWLVCAIIGSIGSFIAFGTLWYILNPNAVLDALNHLSGPTFAKYVITCIMQGAIFATAGYLNHRNK